MRAIKAKINIATPVTPRSAAWPVIRLKVCAGMSYPKDSINLSVIEASRDPIFNGKASFNEGGSSAFTNEKTPKNKIKINIVNIILLIVFLNIINY